MSVIVVGLNHTTAPVEMRERVAKRIRGDAAEGLTVSTFHALGLRMLQIEHERAGLRRGFSIFDSDDSTAQFRDLMPGAKPDAVQAMQGLVSRASDRRDGTSATTIARPHPHPAF